MKDPDELIKKIKVLQDRKALLQLDLDGLHSVIEDYQATLAKNATLSAIVERSQDAILSQDLSGKIISWNPSAAFIFGYTAEEIIGKPIGILSGNDTIPEAENLKNIEQIGHFETVFVTRDGKSLDVSLTISPIKDINGNTIAYSKIIRDISLLKTAEQSSSTLAAIVASSEDAIVSKNLQGIVTSWNNSAERMFGYTAQEMIGKSILTIIPDDRQHEEVRILTILRSGNRVDHFETLRKRKDGSLIHVSLTISPVKNQHGTIIGLSKIARDITDKKLEEQRKHDFISIVSHELKTPLTSLKSYIQITMTRLEREGNTLHLEALSRANKLTDKMTAMITDFLNVSRLESGQMDIVPADFDIHEMISEIIEGCKVLYPARRLVFTGEKGILVHADKEKMTMVMINLINNAIKYDPSDAEIHISCVLKNDGVSIKVSDKGIGISAADQKRLFDRFYRINNDQARKVAGFGIGLYLTAEILRLHGTSIGVKSELGKGSVFHFVLRPAQICLQE